MGDWVDADGILWYTEGDVVYKDRNMKIRIKEGQVVRQWVNREVPKEERAYLWTKARNRLRASGYKAIKKIPHGCPNCQIRLEGFKTMHVWLSNEMASECGFSPEHDAPHMITADVIQGGNNRGALRANEPDLVADEEGAARLKKVLRSGKGIVDVQCRNCNWSFGLDRAVEHYIEHGIVIEDRTLGRPVDRVSVPPLCTTCGANMTEGDFRVMVGLGVDYDHRIDPTVYFGGKVSTNDAGHCLVKITRRWAFERVDRPFGPLVRSGTAFKAKRASKALKEMNNLSSVRCTGCGDAITQVEIVRDE